MLRLKYKYILFCVLFASSFLGFSQSQNELEDAYVPDSLYAVRSALKFDPVQIVLGDYELYYETMLAEGWSVELGAGITRRNYAVGWNNYSLDNLARNVDIKTGYAFSLAVRKYLQPSEELMGPYVAFGVKALRYRTDFEVLDSAGVLTPDVFSERRDYFNLDFLTGYQLLPQSSNIFVDVFVGVAYRFKDFDVVHSEEVHNPDAYRIAPQKGNDFALRLGARIGYGF